MDFFSAVYTFYQSLTSRECQHEKLNLRQQNTCFCPDCGYKVELMWIFVKCRQCDTKRAPRRMPDGNVKPFDKHCRQCGSSEFRLVKRKAIDAYELQYCLSVKEIDYTEERKPFSKPEVQPKPAAAKAQTPPPRSPFTPAFDVVEGEVVRKRYYSQTGNSVWEELPFPWSGEKQERETPKHNTGFLTRRQIS